jgi:hypothetical protein
LDPARSAMARALAPANPTSFNVAMAASTRSWRVSVEREVPSRANLLGLPALAMLTLFVCLSVRSNYMLN